MLPWSSGLVHTGGKAGQSFATSRREELYLTEQPQAPVRPLQAIDSSETTKKQNRTDSSNSKNIDLSYSLKHTSLKLGHNCRQTCRQVRFLQLVLPLKQSTAPEPTKKSTGQPARAVKKLENISALPHSFELLQTGRRG